MMTIGTLISFVTILSITSSAAYVLKGSETNVLTATGHSEEHVLQVRQSTAAFCNIICTLLVFIALHSKKSLWETEQDLKAIAP